jgi:hypothetical protein
LTAGVKGYPLALADAVATDAVAARLFEEAGAVIAAAYVVEVNALPADERADEAVRISIADRLSGRYGKVYNVPVEVRRMRKPPASSFNTQTSAESVRRSRERRVAAGGEALGLTIRTEAAEALRALVSSGHYATKVAAIEAALLNEQKRLRRKLRRDISKDNEPG